MSTENKLVDERPATLAEHIQLIKDTTKQAAIVPHAWLGEWLKEAERQEQTIADLRARVEAQRPGKVDPMGEDVWPALRADIEKAAVEWATYPDSHIMDSDLHGQFIRVMAYVIESTNILHRSPRFSAPAQPLSAQQVFDVVEEFIKQEAERVGTDQPTGLEYPVGHRHWNNMIADLRERLNKLIG